MEYGTCWVIFGKTKFDFGGRILQQKKHFSFYRYFITYLFLKNPEEKNCWVIYQNFCSQPASKNLLEVRIACALLLLCWHWISFCWPGSKQHNVYYVTLSNDVNLSDFTQCFFSWIQLNLVEFVWPQLNDSNKAEEVLLVQFTEINSIFERFKLMPVFESVTC